MFSNEKGLMGEAKSAARLPNIFVVLLLALAFLFGGSLIGGVIDIFINQRWVSNEAMRFSFSLILNFGFVSLLIFRRVTHTEKRTLASMGFSKDNAFKHYLIGFGIGFLFFVAVVAILLFSGNATVEKGISLGSLFGILAVLPGWIIQGGTEEVLTRGWMQNVIGARYNAILGIFVSSTFFGFLHLWNDHVDFIAIANIVLVGVLLSLYVMITDNLWGACGFHSAWNWAQGNIFGFAVSGSYAAGGSLMYMDSEPANVINGGLFGPEAGIVTTIVLVIGIACMVIQLRSQNEKDKSSELDSIA